MLQVAANAALDETPAARLLEPVTAYEAPARAKSDKAAAPAPQPGAKA